MNDKFDWLARAKPLLVNAREMAREQVPSADEINGLRIGDSVKVATLSGNFWLKIESRDSRRFTSTLALRVPAQVSYAASL